MFIKVLDEIWLNVIKTYEKGQICTERHLQAELYYQFKVCSLLNDYQFWLEPTLDVYVTEKVKKIKIKPDIIVSQGNTIVAIIEIKYEPDGEVYYRHDINKFGYFTQKDKPKVAIRTNPSTGKWLTENEFNYSDKVLFVFAVIANKKAHALYKELWTDIVVPVNLNI